MDVSIIIPVFNKSGLTRVCLDALKKTVPATLRYETIVIDNNSTDDTQRVLSEFPWITVISNPKNVGFAGANNQGARAASGTMLILLNNDTEPQAGWIQALLLAAEAENVGAVGARLLFPNRTVQHAGVVIGRERFGPYHYTPYHYLWSSPATAKAVMQTRDYQSVTGACIATPRQLYLALGGLDETFWNGYEDIDYCFKVLRDGKRVVYEPQAE
ncbi:MAG: glycosyltransferase family 2 protein, partial [Candidatus Eremiobacteraeota bacterium]|nr:glycosyltransferase family 2 protein [Candidatus Eremiobacteraeota bacterium]